MALRTRVARCALKGWRRSRVLATGSRSAAAGTSLSVGCRAAESSIFGQPICLANSNHSSMATSGSASRRSRGVNSCSAAVNTLSFIGFGLKSRPGDCASGVPASSLTMPRSGMPRTTVVGILNDLIAKSRCKQHEHDGRKTGWINPDDLPVMHPADEIQIVDAAGNPESDQHADTVGRQSDQALCGALMPCTRFGIGVDLTRNEEEVIAHAVERDANDQH